MTDLATGWSPKHKKKVKTSMTRNGYVKQLSEAVIELRLVDEWLTLTLDVNANFYVTSSRVRFRDDKKELSCCTPPTPRGPDPLWVIQETLKEWRALRPPQFITVNNRRIIWIDGAWTFINPEEESK